MVRLRTSQGLDTEQFKQRFGVSALNCLLTAAKQHLERGLMDNKNGILRITPQGVMLSDAIISDLFVS
jgi:oxygen-independent coproporphyrinogen-3 oxidase